jgi:hypothetical protein
MTKRELESAIPPDVYLIAELGQFISLNLKENAIGRDVGEGDAWWGQYHLMQMIKRAREIRREKRLSDDDGYIPFLESVRESEFERLMAGKRLTNLDCQALFNLTQKFLDQA